MKSLESKSFGPTKIYRTAHSVSHDINLWNEKSLKSFRFLQAVSNCPSQIADLLYLKLPAEQQQESFHSISS